MKNVRLVIDATKLSLIHHLGDVYMYCCFNLYANICEYVKLHKLLIYQTVVGYLTIANDSYGLCCVYGE